MQKDLKLQTTNIRFKVLFSFITESAKNLNLVDRELNWKLKFKSNSEKVVVIKLN